MTEPLVRAIIVHTIQPLLRFMAVPATARRLELPPLSDGAFERLNRPRVGHDQPLIPSLKAQLTL